MGLAALRNTQVFSIYLPVTTSLRFVLKQALEVSILLQDMEQVEGRASLTFKTKSFNVYNQAVEFSEVSSQIMHFPRFPNMTYLAPVFPSKLFSPDLSPPSCVTARNWYYLFPAPCLPFSCSHIPHLGQTECYMFPVISLRQFL